MRHCLLASILLLLSQPAYGFGLGDISDIGGMIGGDSDTIYRAEQALNLAQALIPISDEEELILGRAVAARVIGRYGITQAPQQTYYLNLIGMALVQRSDRSDIAYHFAILDTDDVNAYACPGGFVFITRGALSMVRDESELAAVLAHEIAHVSERHIVNAMQKSKIMKVGGNIASDAFAYGGPLFDKMTDFATDALFEGLSKSDEYDSDKKAIEYLDRLGYDYPAMFDVIDLLDERRKAGKTQVLAKTHPTPKMRLKKLEQANRKLDLEEPTSIRLKPRFAQQIQSQ